MRLRAAIAELDPARILLVVFILGTGLLVVLPVLTLLWESLSRDTQAGRVISLGSYAQVLGRGSTYSLLFTTAAFSASMTVIAGTLGLVFAWIAARTNAPFRSLMPVAILLPYLVPPTLGSISWIFLLSPSNGIINEWLAPLLGPRFFNIYSFSGMVFVETLYTFPLSFMFFYATLVTLDPTLEEASAVAGAGAWGTFWDTTVPSMIPTILSVATLLFIIGFESFDVAWFLGYPAKIYTLSVEIFLLTRYNFPADIGAASVYGAIALVPAMLLVWTYRRVTRDRGRFTAISGKGYREGQVDIGWLRIPAAVLFYALVVIIGIVPILLLLGISIDVVHWPFSIGGTPSLANFIWILSDDESRGAILNTAVLAIGGALAVVIASFFIAYLTMRTDLRGRGVLDYLAFLPFGFPGTVLAVGLISLLIATPVYDTIWIMLIAFAIKFLPYGLRNISNAMLQIDRELEEASLTSGAGLFTTLRRIVLPLVTPGLIAAWSLLFIVYGRQFSLPLMLSSTGSEVITITLFQEWDAGKMGHVAAYGIFLVGCSLPFLILARWLRRGTQPAA
jgi:iron(III) transport system permease protein